LRRLGGGGNKPAAGILGKYYARKKGRKKERKNQKKGLKTAGRGARGQPTAGSGAKTKGGEAKRNCGEGRGQFQGKEAGTRDLNKVKLKSKK